MALPNAGVERRVAVEGMVSKVLNRDGFALDELTDQKAMHVQLFERPGQKLEPSIDSPVMVEVLQETVLRRLNRGK
ncbi:hypothetical protein ACXPVS_02215 [Pseudomonas sp. Ma2-10]